VLGIATAVHTTQRRYAILGGRDFLDSHGLSVRKRLGNWFATLRLLGIN